MLGSKIQEEKLSKSQKDTAEIEKLNDKLETMERSMQEMIKSMNLGP